MSDERRSFIKSAVGTAAAIAAPHAFAAGSDAPEKKEVRIGFIPLTDCASVVMASVRKYDEKYGIKIIPSKEASWAAVRDKLVSGELDLARAVQPRQVEVRDALRRRMPDFAYASRVPVAGAAGCSGLVFQATSAEPFAPAQVDAIAALLGLEGPTIPRCADPRRGRRRLLRLRGEGRDARLQALRLVGEQPAADWLRALWQDRLPVSDYGRQLPSPAAAVPAGLTDRGRQICNCLDVSEPQIRECLLGAEGLPAHRLAAVQAKL